MLETGLIDLGYGEGIGAIPFFDYLLTAFEVFLKLLVGLALDDVAKSLDISIDRYPVIGYLHRGEAIITVAWWGKVTERGGSRPLLRFAGGVI